MLVALCRADRPHRLAVRPRADRLHPGAGPGLPHHRHPAAAGRLARAHRRGGAARRPRSSSTRPASRTPCPSPASTARPSPTRPNAGAIFSALAPFEERVKRRATAPTRSWPTCAAARRHPGRLHHHHPAAAGARHRHRRRLQDDGAGPRRRAARRRSKRRRRRSPRPPTRCRAWPACSRCSAPARRASTPTSTASAREKLGVVAGQGVRGAAGLSRLGLRQRLQLSRPHLPGDGAGRRAVPRRAPTTSPSSRRATRAARWCRSARSRSFHDVTGPYRVPRYDLYPGGRGAGRHAARLLLGLRAGGDGEARGRASAGRHSASNGPTSPTSSARPATPTLLIFGASVLFVFLVLAAQYESWSLPLAVVLIVPMCLLAAVTRPAAARHGRQHPGADRLRRAGRAGREERDPDRRVRRARRRTAGASAAAGGGRRRRARGCGRS